jgi:hypothetical protein
MLPGEKMNKDLDKQLDEIVEKYSCNTQIQKSEKTPRNLGKIVKGSLYAASYLASLGAIAGALALSPYAAIVGGAGAFSSSSGTVFHEKTIDSLRDRILKPAQKLNTILLSAAAGVWASYAVHTAIIQGPYSGKADMGSYFICGLADLFTGTFVAGGAAMGLVALHRLFRVYKIGDFFK